ncbi:unnamed protein product [Linum tenue]|uniref:Transmembrane protein n=1 Tax=Linum tenue TaxID=586396 RepID=A0AAV0KZU6_9ROSI|nr:unnamed protein product [Linum tenue]
MVTSTTADGTLSVDLHHHRHPSSHSPSSPSASSTASSLCRIIVESLEILLRNRALFLSITLFFAFPLCFLLSSLSVSSIPLRSKILRLEYLATVAPTHYESRQVWKESREVFLSLLQLKLLHLVPANSIALIAAISAVTAADSGRKRPVGFRSTIAAVRPAWARVAATAICVYAISWAYAGLPAAAAAVLAPGIGRSGIRVGIWVVGLAVEVYMMAVMGMALVVSIVERRSGWEAIRVGSDLLEGRRVCGWVLSGGMAAATGVIGWRMEEAAVEDVMTATWVERWWERAVVVGVYAAVVVWGFVVSTVFYREARKRHGIRDHEMEILEA